MGITLAGTTSTPEEYADALESHGFETGEVNSYGEGESPSTEEAVDPAAPAPPAETEQPDQVAATVEEEAKPGEGQEPSQEEQEKQEAEREQKVMKGEEPEAYKGEKRQLKRIDNLTKRLRTAETGREGLEGELAELKAAQAEKAPAPEKEAIVAVPKPERPSRPRKANFEYDEERYEAALEKYDAEELPAYEEKLADWKAAERLEADRTERAAAEAKQAEADAKVALAERQAKYKEALAEYGDLDEVMASVDGGVRMSSAMQAVLEHLVEPEEAAAIVNYLARHPEESKEITQATLASKDNPGPQESNAIIAKASLKLGSILAKAGEKKPAAPAAPPANTTKKPTAAAPPMDPVSTRAGSTAVETTRDIKTTDKDALKRFERARNASRN